MDAESDHRHPQAQRGAYVEGVCAPGPAPTRAAPQESALDEAALDETGRDEAGLDETGLDEAGLDGALLARLDRIVELRSRRRRESLNAELLQELRALVQEAERLRPPSDGSEKSRGVVERPARRLHGT